MIPMLTLFLPVIVCHKIVETFKHHSYIVPKATVGKSGLVLMVEITSTTLTFVQVDVLLPVIVIQI